jgi:hypothetical protein
MSDLLGARSQMGMSLAFHIIFAVVGVALPLMMTIAEFLFWSNWSFGRCFGSRRVLMPPGADDSCG